MADIIDFPKHNLRHECGMSSQPQSFHFTDPVEVLEHFLELAKAYRLCFLAIHAYQCDGSYTHAEIGLVTDEPEQPEEPA
jgi:hypothetical protein